MSQQLQKPALSPVAISIALVSVGVFCVLFFINPYSTGYKFERVPIWSVSENVQDAHRRSRTMSAGCSWTMPRPARASSG